MPMVRGVKGDEVIHPIIVLMTLMAFFGSAPQQGASPAGILQYLSELDTDKRQQELLLFDSGYEQLLSGSGAFEGASGISKLNPFSIVEIRVWQPLTPANLSILDRSGFWPAGWSPENDIFAAVVTGEPDIDLLRSSEFIRSVKPWNTAHYSNNHEPSNWSGHFLLRILGEKLPAGGEWIRRDLARVPGASADFLNLCEFPGVIEVSWEILSNPESAQFRADDSRRLVGCPSVWEYYQGEGIIVGVLDTGVWSEHPDLSPAVISGPPDQDGHGTAVCGVISSRGQVSLGCEFNGSGVAYNGSLFVLERPSGMTPSQLDGFFSQFQTAGCEIVNNSWGFTSSGYDEFCEIVDTWVDNEDMVLVFSAGNQGGTGTITSPGNAKNCITVGAVTYIPDEDGNCYLATYSSQGPTQDDQRLKPDILAPGGEFSGSTMLNGVVSTNAMYNGLWLDDPENRWPGVSSYTRRAGTSMAAAHVSGAIALCFEKYGDLVHPEDISALLAASSIPLAGNTGSPLSGYATTGYGYGLLDAFHLPGVYFSEEVDRVLWVYETYIEGQLYREWTFYIPSTTLSLSGAMAYSDVPGTGIRNDLDFSLISPDEVTYNYTLPAGVTGESPLEKICIENPLSGAWRARIVAESWSDPGNPFEEEDYSLVVYTYSRIPSVRVLSPVDTTIYAAPGADLELPLSVINDGGYIAVGTWGSIEAPSGFGGEVSVPRYMGNLVYRDAVSVDTFSIETPDQPGTYDLLARVAAANLGLQPDSSLFQVVLAYPDLIVSSPSPDLSPPFFVGQTVLFSVVVTNQGQGPAGECELVLYLEEDPDSTSNPLISFMVPPLQGGETSAFSAPVTFSYFDMGIRYMIAVVDDENQIKESSESNNRSVYGPFSVEGILAPPENLSAESGYNGFIPLSWSAPSPESSGTGSKGLFGYQIYRSLSPLGPDTDPIVSLSSNDTSYVDSLVSNGVTYYYWATTLYENPYGESDYSNMASATPQGPSGSLSGEVWDIYTGQRLRDVSVSVVEMGLEQLTDSDGMYSFENVPVGPVPISAEKYGYITVTDTVFIYEDEMTVHDFPMERDFGQGMSVIPNPFTPNGDGINDVANFIWPAADGDWLTVIIYSMEGIPIVTIEGEEPSWDGRDDGGGIVSGGIYVYMAWAGNTRMSGVVCVAR